MGRPSKCSPELRERAVRMVLEGLGEYGSEWKRSVRLQRSSGCSPETLRKWKRRGEVDRGERAGLTSDERERLKTLERENRELKRANEILRKSSAYFAQAELDRRPQ